MATMLGFEVYYRYNYTSYAVTDKYSYCSCNVTLFVCTFYRMCYFTVATVHKKCNFITQLSNRFGSGGLSCSFTDKDLTQYFTWKKKHFHIKPNSCCRVFFSWGNNLVEKFGSFLQIAFWMKMADKVHETIFGLKNVPAFGTQTGREVILKKLLVRFI